MMKHPWCSGLVVHGPVLNREQDRWGPHDENHRSRLRASASLSESKTSLLQEQVPHPEMQKGWPINISQPARNDDLSPWWTNHCYVIVIVICVIVPVHDVIVCFGDDWPIMNQPLLMINPVWWSWSSSSTLKKGFVKVYGQCWGELLLSSSIGSQRDTQVVCPTHHPARTPPG